MFHYARSVERLISIGALVGKRNVGRPLVRWIDDLINLVRSNCGADGPSVRVVHLTTETTCAGTSNHKDQLLVYNYD